MMCIKPVRGESKIVLPACTAAVSDSMQLCMYVDKPSYCEDDEASAILMSMQSMFHPYASPRVRFQVWTARNSTWAAGACVTAACVARIASTALLFD